MPFHSNQLSWAINYYFIKLYSKYQSPCFICFSKMLAPVISSLDEIYCILLAMKNKFSGKRQQSYFFKTTLYIIKQGND